MTKKRCNTRFSNGDIVVVASPSYALTGSARLATIINITSDSPLCEFYLIQFEDGTTDVFDNVTKHIVKKNMKDGKCYFEVFDVYSLKECSEYAKYMVKTRNKLEIKYMEKLCYLKKIGSEIEKTPMRKKNRLKDANIDEDKSQIARLKRRFAGVKAGDNVIVKYLEKTNTKGMAYASKYEVCKVKSIKFNGNKNLSLWLITKDNKVFGGDNLTDKNCKLQILASGEEDECMFCDGFVYMPDKALKELERDKCEICEMKEAFIKQREDFSNLLDKLNSFQGYGNC